MIKRLLIANRGEIACRIIKTARKMGITTITVKSDAEINPLHCQLSDESYSLGSLPLENCYLNQKKIIALAKRVHADAIHPGYGFLSENADFAAYCEKENIIFVGPSSHAIRLMGKKDDAKIYLKKAQIPVVPGYDGQDQNTDTLVSQAKQIGLPVLIKAASGGGGKGMRKIFHLDELVAGIDSAKREALNAFGDDTLIIEKYLQNVRHIEIQIIRDHKGNTLHLYERDCSVQRRHQKIIEEAPAICVPNDIRKAMQHTAIKIAETINYISAGTIEFLYADKQFYFLEMNTRIQVEHPVSEMITDIDLIAWQLHIANGDNLPVKQEQIPCKGHAIEARIYAEDPHNQFLPTTGSLHGLHFPNQTQHVRVDTGIQSGDTIGIHFDPMIAKLTVWGKNRSEAIDQLNGCLHHFATLGLRTNIDFLIDLIQTNSFTQNEIFTHTLDEQLENYLHDHVIEDKTLCLMGIIVCSHFDKLLSSAVPIWQQLPRWRMNHRATLSMRIHTQQDESCLSITHNDKGYSVTSEKSTHPYEIEVSTDKQNVVYSIDGEVGKAKYSIVDKTLWFFTQGKHLCAHINPPKQSQAQTALHTHIQAPMPGIIRQIFVQPDETVVTGQKLVALEAMKMEHTLTATRDGKIKQIHHSIGDQVEQGKALIQFHS